MIQIPKNVKNISIKMSVGVKSVYGDLEDYIDKSNKGVIIKYD